MIAFFDLLDDEDEKLKFQQLYNEYLNFVMWVAMEKLHNTFDAEECVQETFLYIAKNFSKVDEVKSGRTKCYLATISKGFAITKFNKNNKQKCVSIDEESDFNDFVLFDINSTQMFEDYGVNELKFAIDLLEDESKTLIYLSYYFGYKSKEIAKMYNITDSLVRKKIQLAKQKIKKTLDCEG